MLAATPARNKQNRKRHQQKMNTRGKRRRKKERNRNGRNALFFSRSETAAVGISRLSEFGVCAHPPPPLLLLLLLFFFSPFAFCVGGWSRRHRRQLFFLSFYYIFTLSFLFVVRVQGPVTYLRVRPVARRRPTKIRHYLRNPLKKKTNRSTEMNITM